MSLCGDRQKALQPFFDGKRGVVLCYLSQELTLQTVERLASGRGRPGRGPS